MGIIMFNQRLHFSLLLITVFSISAIAQVQQSGSISGVVLTSELKPLPQAVVKVLKLPDSSLVKGATTQSNGSFQITALPYNSYIIEVRYIGYKQFLSKEVVVNAKSNTVVLDTIILESSASQTGEVSVTAMKNYMDREIDRTVVNVDAQIANAGRTILEVLEQTPSVMVDNNGTITMKGKSGVMVFVDDKPTYLTGTDLQNYLSSMPASTVDKIELIPNPPAMYDAAGNAGIINLKTKRIQTGGFFGNTTLNYNQGRYARSNNSLNLTLNRDDYSIFTNLGVGLMNVFQDLTIYRNYKNPDNTPQSSFTQNSIIRREGVPMNARVAMDWYVHKNTTLGFAIRGIYQPMDATSTNLGVVSSANGTPIYTVNADNSNTPRFSNLLGNINLRHKFDSVGTQLTVDADYVWYNTINKQRFVNALRTMQGSIFNTDTLNGSLPTNINILAVKADFTKPYPEQNLTFQAGVKSAYTATDNTADYRRLFGGVERPDYTLSNQFRYDELISAAYINVNGSVFGNLEYQLGLRAERTDMNGKQLGNPVVQAVEFKRNYTNLFPTLFLQMPLDSSGDHILNLSFGRRIDRPVYQDLNPFISPLDKFTFYTGNPFLQPSFANTISLTHSWSNIISTTFEYSRANNGVQETIFLEDTIYFSRPANITTFDQYSLQIANGMPITNWWTSNIVVEGGLMKFNDNVEVKNLNANRAYVVLNVQESFVLSDTWSAELSGNVRTKLALAQLVLGEVGQLNLAFQKKLFDGKGSLKLSFNDILLTQKPFGQILNLPNTDAGWNSILDTRQAAITFTYRFGSTNVKREQYNGQGSESERQRVKQG
jgi:outer membrane receptor protein involved in Fe transport